MSRRHWRKDASVLVLFAVASAVIAVAQLAEVVLRFWAVPLLLAAGAGAGGFLIGRRTAPTEAQMRGFGSSLAAENAALRDQADQLRADLYDAEASARMAWEAASAARPLRLLPPSAARLTETPFSGVRRLFPEEDQ